MAAVETSRLSKSFGRVHSLVDCSLTVPNGCVFGLLGPNGAGKTTLIRTILGFMRPTGGTALVCGYDIVDQSLSVREHVSYLPGDARLYRSMKGSQVLELFSGLHKFGDLARSRDVAKRLDLELSRRVMFMSTGMRQKLAISIVLGCHAPLLILDEPTANLDPNVRDEVLALVREARQRGSSVLLSSHIFSDIDDSCDQVAILRSGRLVAEQDISSLQNLHIVRLRPSSGGSIEGLPSWVTRAEDRPSFLEFLRVGSAPTQSDAADIKRASPTSSSKPSSSKPTASPKTDSRNDEIEAHLSGSPNDWMQWLSEQPVEILGIEQAGIKAIYSRVHQSGVDAAQLPPPTNSIDAASLSNQEHSAATWEDESQAEMADEPQGGAK